MKGFLYKCNAVKDKFRNEAFTGTRSTSSQRASQCTER